MMTDKKYLPMREICYERKERKRMLGKFSYLIFRKIQEDFGLKKIKVSSIESSGQQTFPLKDQRVNSDGFEGHMVSLATIQLSQLLNLAPKSSRQYAGDRSRLQLYFVLHFWSRREELRSGKFR